MELKKVVQIFLKQKGSLKKPLLLGFSGGTDSLVLADCLMKLGVDFQLAHFDHAWREESASECEKLADWAHAHNLVFHSERSRAGSKSEMSAREERFEFFEKVFTQGEFQAIVLAHQSRDQAETILKRIFEGARLFRLCGISEETIIGEIPIWRPFLFVPKETILSYIKESGLQPIEDPSNEEKKYLRARMRKSIFPSLSQEFGKEIESPLIQIGRQAAHFAKYLEERTKEINPLCGPFGKMWDFKNAHPLEIEYILCRNFDGLTGIRDQIIEAVSSHRANWKIPYKNGEIIVDRLKFFYLERPLPEFTKRVPLKDGNFSEGEWEWEIRTSLQEKSFARRGWIDWWKGKISLPIKKGSYELIPSQSIFRKERSDLKTPAFLRGTLPAISENEKPIADFLTGYGKNRGVNPFLLVTIAINARR